MAKYRLTWAIVHGISLVSITIPQIIWSSSYLCCNADIVSCCSVFIWLHSFCLKINLNWCRLNKSWDLIYNMMTTVNNLILLTHLTKHCNFIIKNVTVHSFPNCTSRLQQCPIMCLEFSGIFCTTSKISPPKKAL